MGLKYEDKRINYFVNWVEYPDVKCPNDRPIGDCDIKLEKQIYTIGIWIGQKL